MEELIKVSSFGRANKKLKIDKVTLRFEQCLTSLSSVTEMRYGIEPIRFDMFTIGTKYVIDLKTNDNAVKMVFRSYFAISTPYFSEVFMRILNSIWDATLVRIADETIAHIENGGSVMIGKCKLSDEGVFLNGFLIEWNDLTYQKNYNRLTINSKSNSKAWTNLHYTRTYNVDVLLAVLEWKLDDKKNKKNTQQ